MKKTAFISIFILVSFAILIIVPRAFAELPKTQDELINPFKNDQTLRSPIEDVYGGQHLVVEAIRWFYTIVFVAALITILLAAFNFIRGGSDEKKLALAKAQLKWAVVGMIVGLVATGVSSVVNDFLSNTYIPPVNNQPVQPIPDNNGPQIPTQLSPVPVPNSSGDNKNPQSGSGAGLPYGYVPVPMPINDVPTKEPQQVPAQ